MAGSGLMLYPVEVGEWGAGGRWRAGARDTGRARSPPERPKRAAGDRKRDLEDGRGRWRVIASDTGSAPPKGPDGAPRDDSVGGVRGVFPITPAQVQSGKSNLH